MNITSTPSTLPMGLTRPGRPGRIGCGGLLEASFSMTTVPDEGVVTDHRFEAELKKALNQGPIHDRKVRLLDRNHVLNGLNHAPGARPNGHLMAGPG